MDEKARNRVRFPSGNDRVIFSMNTDPCICGTAFETSHARWHAVVTRDPSADGVFFYGVTTTGVYCVPSCKSRQPRKENIRFFDSIAKAQAAGFRPCKRCSPGNPSRTEMHIEAVRKACKFLAEAEEYPTLKALARKAGISAHHFHRIFKKVVGVTPKQFAAQLRSEKVRCLLRLDRSVTETVHEAGYQSTGGFYEGIQAVLGMAPQKFRRGGADVQIRFCLGDTTLGALLVAVSDRGICALTLGDDPQMLIKQLQDWFPNAVLEPADRHLTLTLARVIALIEAPGETYDLPLDIRGTAFQQKVWQALREIPSGTTATYRQLATMLGIPRATRAVAAACAANRIAVAIPCHRVIRTGGKLAGYRWGIARKQELINRESTKQRSASHVAYPTPTTR